MTVFDTLDTAITLSNEEAILLRSVEEVATRSFAPRAAELDRTAAFPWENISEINALGLNSVFVPEAYGGAGLSYTAYLACLRSISRACASTGIIWATTFHGIKPILTYGTEDLKQRLMPVIVGGGLGALAITEPEAGSDALAMRTTFREDGDTVRIDGEKIFITNGDVADVMTLFGRWDGIDNRRDALGTIVVEAGTPGVSVQRREAKMGHRASSTVALSFNGATIPKVNVLAGPGQGFNVLLGALTLSRPSTAAQALGIARAAFDASVAHLNQRRQSGRRIGENQGLQFMLADLATDLALVEAWLWSVAKRVDAGDTDIGIESSMLKLRASDVAMRLTTEAVQFLGGQGYIQGTLVERLMRDAKVTQIWEGTNQIHRSLIGRSFLTRS